MNCMSIQISTAWLLMVSTLLLFVCFIIYLARRDSQQSGWHGLLITVGGVGFFTILFWITLCQFKYDANNELKQKISTNLPGKWSELYAKFETANYNSTKLAIAKQFLKYHKDIEPLSWTGLELFVDEVERRWWPELHEILDPHITLEPPLK